MQCQVGDTKASRVQPRYGIVDLRGVAATSQSVSHLEVLPPAVAGVQQSTM